MTSNKNIKIEVLYLPNFDEKERSIFERVFGKDNVSLHKYFVKGVTAGSFDVQFIIKFIEDPIIKQVLIGMFLLLVKELFDRNRARKFYKESRPRYTNLVIKKKKTFITISNLNKENRLTITQSQVDLKTSVEDYSDKKLRELLDEND